MTGASLVELNWSGNYRKILEFRQFQFDYFILFGVTPNKWQAHCIIFRSTSNYTKFSGKKKTLY